jgi:hypothetical protein
MLATGANNIFLSNELRQTQMPKINPRVADVKFKLQAVFNQVTLPGVGSPAPFTPRFCYLFLSRAGESVANEDSAHKRFTGLNGYFRKDTLPEQVIQYLCRLVEGLDRTILCHGEADAFMLHLNDVRGQAFAPSLVKLIAAEDFYRHRRADILRWLKKYYANVQDPPPTLSTFPLIVQHGYILNHPAPLVLAEKQLLGPLRSDFPEPMAPEVFGTGMTYLEFRTSHRKRTSSVEGLLWNGFCYRLMEIELSESSPFPRLHFARARYFDYINLGEARGFEAAYFMQIAGMTPEQMAASPHCTFRKFPGSIFNPANRVAIASVDTITIIIDQKSGNKHFLQHQRNQSVATAPGTLCVVPAGTFQPVIPVSQTEAANMAPAWQQDYSIMETMVREFLEECLGLEEKIMRTPPGRDWRKHDRQVAEAYKALKEALLENRGKAKAWFFGIGFDPVTEYPEMLTALVIDAELFRSLVLLGREGLGEEVKVSEQVFQDIIVSESSSRWTASGLACIQLAHLHYGVLIRSLDK